MKVSIVIPVYNAAPFLCACLDSVMAAARRLTADFPAWQTEVICVDDGSTDDSWNVLRAYASRQPLPADVNTVRQKNLGEGAARNTGISRATGDYLNFIDADDLMTESALADAASLLTREPQSDFVSVGLCAFPDGETVSTAERAQSQHARIVRRGLCSAVDMTSCVQMLIRRAIGRAVRFPSYSLGADRVYVYRIACRARLAVMSDKTGYLYRVRKESMSHARPPFRRRWDDFRHAGHVLILLLFHPQAGWQLRLRYVRMTATKFGLVLTGGRI